MERNQQARFTQSCTDAAFGYANAATAAYAAVANDVLAFWTSALTGSRSTHGSATPFRLAGNPLPWPVMMPAFAMWPWAGMAMLSAAQNDAAFGPMVRHWQALMRMMPGGPAVPAWPMAYTMISAGVPESVAWPTAKANAATIEAAEVLAQSLSQSFPSYHSEGGYSSAQWNPQGRRRAKT